MHRPNSNKNIDFSLPVIGKSLVSLTTPPSFLSHSSSTQITVTGDDESILAPACFGATILSHKSIKTTNDDAQSRSTVETTTTTTDKIGDDTTDTDSLATMKNRKSSLAISDHSETSTSKFPDAATSTTTVTANNNSRPILPYFDKVDISQLRQKTLNIDPKNNCDKKINDNNNTGLLKHLAPVGHQQSQYEPCYSTTRSQKQSSCSIVVINASDRDLAEMYCSRNFEDSSKNAADLKNDRKYEDFFECLIPNLKRIPFNYHLKH